MPHIEFVQQPCDPLHSFECALGGKDPKTVVAYIATVRDLVDWLGPHHDGSPFKMQLLRLKAIYKIGEEANSPAGSSLKRSS